MTFSIESISGTLKEHLKENLDNSQELRYAAVAMILREGENGLELLFIRRALHDGDPWSGNIAFPGGKAEPGEDPRQTAERETLEEIGIDLNRAIYLGRMQDVRGSYLPIIVSCFVYWLSDPSQEIIANGEVNDTFWANLDDLYDFERHLIATVSFGGDELEAPAVALPWPDAPVLWGLTYRLAISFLEMARTCN